MAKHKGISKEENHFTDVRFYEPEEVRGWHDIRNCVHGLSADLCSDPINHYPADNPYDDEPPF